MKSYKDYMLFNKLPHTWCAGCGHGIVLQSIAQVMADLDLDKHDIALVSGILAGLGFGENSQAGLITRGLAEIPRLGVKMGAKRATFSGLAGVGDLVATCSSPLSRNRSAGVALAQGKSLEEITQGTHMVIEGINAAPVVRQLALAHGVEMPIIEQLYQVLFAKKSVEIAIADLMKRVAKKE